MTADLRLEQLLDQLNVAWTLNEQIPLDQIDTKAGLANQARLQPVDPDVVDRYSAAMEDGAHFPPVLLRQQPNGTLLPLGGNHRLAAAQQAGRPHLAGYIIRCDQAVAGRLMYEDNARHGLAPSTGERTLQVAHLIATGTKPQDAARIVGVHPTLATAVVHAERANKRAAALRIRLFKQLPVGHRARLQALRDDQVFHQAADLAVRSGLTQVAVGQFVTELNEPAADTAEIIARHTQRYASAPDRRRSTPLTRLLDALVTISGFDTGRVNRLCDTPERRTDIARRAMAGADQLTRLVKQLNR